MEERLPGHMRQIGQADGAERILIEEYVSYYLQEIMKNEKEPQILVFFGDGFEKDGIKYYFLKGAAAHRALGNGMKRPDEFYFRKVGERYFPELKGIGWCCIEEKREILEILQNMQEQDFGDAAGYCLYFDHNAGMEEYILSHEQKHDTYVRKEATARSRFTGQKKRLMERWKRPSPVWAVQVLNIVSLCILLICCMIAVTTLNQYDKMKQLEEAVTYLEISMEEQKNLPDE